MKQPLFNEGDKRSIILASAFDIFFEKGFNQTKIDDVAERAGIGKGTVYLYFSSKEELLREMLKSYVETYKTFIEGKMAGTDDPPTKIKRLFLSHCELLQQSPHMARLNLGDFSFVNEELKQWLETQKIMFVEQLQAVVDDGIKNGCFRQVNTYLAATFIVSSLGACYTQEGPLNTEQVLELVDLVLKGLAK